MQVFLQPNSGLFLLIKVFWYEYWRLKALIYRNSVATLVLLSKDFPTN